MITDTFKTEKDLRIKYPKNKHFKLKDIFILYWDNFVKFAEYKVLYIRPVVFRDVKRMMICNSPKLSSSFLSALPVIIINSFIILVNLDSVIPAVLNILNNTNFTINAKD